MRRVSYLSVLLGLVILIAPAVAENDGPLDGKSIRLMKPVQGHIEQGFGPEYNPLLRREQMHTGVLFSVEDREPVLAAADGTVDYRQTGREKFSIVIRHARGFESHYGNLTEALQEAGTRVRKGDVIGFVDRSEEGGLLYYEFHYRGNALDPVPFFEEVGDIS